MSSRRTRQQSPPGSSKVTHSEPSPTSFSQLGGKPGEVPGGTSWKELTHPNTSAHNKGAIKAPWVLKGRKLKTKGELRKEHPHVLFRAWAPELSPAPTAAA